MARLRDEAKGEPATAGPRHLAAPFRYNNPCSACPAPRSLFPLSCSPLVAPSSRQKLRLLIPITSASLMARLPNVFFDINIDGHHAGRIVFHLFDDITPVTARNFRELATGQHNFGYAGSTIHRIIPEFMIQGGDITNRDGTGGKSIFGPTFTDENFDLRHDQPGLISMANRGPGANSSQYFITTAPAPWCDGKNVVFGEVVSGMEVVKRIQTYASGDHLRRPSALIVVERCGTL
ncbi:hypothetical protein BV25DRAFT_1831922 [Artomyces pyxidatus]|uniref:Uncharacterized protein n=1 Tax=Artomyces pyxidatus TaxID=48021 RepID=A0ACB8SLR1_9AGAM|nr:hypothetical protein BV25DRAFT_1831922 [Artomyces pyxidatus]